MNARLALAIFTLFTLNAHAHYDNDQKKALEITTGLSINRGGQHFIVDCSKIERPKEFNTFEPKSDKVTYKEHYTALAICKETLKVYRAHFIAQCKPGSKKEYRSFFEDVAQNAGLNTTMIGLPVAVECSKAAVKAIALMHKLQGIQQNNADNVALCIPFKSQANYIEPLLKAEQRIV